MLHLARRVSAAVLGGMVTIGLIVLGGQVHAQAAGTADELLSAAVEHTCALTPLGAVDCWGGNVAGRAQDRPGPYTQLSAGAYHTCALTLTGTADCWGDTSEGQAQDQPGPYTQLSAGAYYTCALTAKGAADCWGANTAGQTEDQVGPYTALSTGTYHTCALTPAGAADCWGYNVSGQAADQVGPYTALSAGEYHTCALTPAGAVDCWGYNVSGQAADQVGPYTQLSAGASYTCALRPVGVADCWGRNLRGEATDQVGPYGAYDRTPATASPSLSPPPNAAGWHRSPVTVVWNWQDNAGGSGLDVATCRISSTSQGEGPLTLRATCSDRVGNSATAVVSVKVDQTAPTLQPVVSPNPVTQGQTATVVARAADGLSGVGEQHCDALDTRTPGPKEVSCTATDVAGNSARSSTTYTVHPARTYVPWLQR